MSGSARYDLGRQNTAKVVKRLADVDGFPQLQSETAEELRGGLSQRPLIPRP
jgi:hypothetical protein